jgi:hypothetical protein
VQVGTSGQASALIDGRVVQVGDSFGGSRVAAIDVDGVTLRDAKGRIERLRLISAAIAKHDGAVPTPMASTSNTNQSRPQAALASGAAVPAGSPGRGGHEGHRP